MAAAADEQHQIAQRDRYRSADGRLDLGGVGREARYNFTGARCVEKCRRQAREVGEYIGAQIGDDALAQCGDEVVTQRAGYREHGDDRDHHREIAVDQLHRLVGETEIDHPPDGQRHDQSGECSNGQRSQCGKCAPAISADIWNEPGQRPEFDLAPRARRGAPATSRPRPSLEKLMRRPFVVAPTLAPLMPCGLDGGQSWQLAARVRVLYRSRQIPLLLARLRPGTET